MLLFWTTAVLLGLASAFDGYSTVRFVKRGYEEGNTRWLLGPRPSWRVVYFRGGAVIAAELLSVLALGRIWPVIGAVLCAMLGVQAIFHVMCAVKNLRLK